MRKTVKLILLFVLAITLCISSVSVVFATFQDSGLHNSLISDSEANLSSSSEINTSENIFSGQTSTQNSRAFNEFNTYKSSLSSGSISSQSGSLTTQSSSVIDSSNPTEAIGTVGAPSPSGNFTGWVSLNGIWFYFINDVLQTGWVWVGSDWYYLGTGGAMQTGWLLQSESWYYLNSGGDMQRGWALVNNRWFFMSQSGVMQIGWLNEGGQKYYLLGDGAMAKGWHFLISEWYLLAEDGSLQKGWLNQGESRYYLDENGVMSRGLKTIDEKKYFFHPNGVMAKGWVTIEGKDCYFDENGVCDPTKIKDDSFKDGWVQSNGETYFYVSGQIQKDWFWDGTSWYYFHPETGARQYGWLDEGGFRYYLDKDGKMHRGWLFIESEKNWYFLDASGHMRTGSICVNGKWYLLGSNGVYISEISNPGGDTASPDNPTKGIDISTWQGDNIDWNAVKASGVEYVIIRSNFGWSGVDNRFKQNIQGANAVGLKIGVYLYSYATTPAEARMEFENLKGTIEPYRNMINYPVAYDLEDNNAQGNLSVDQLTDIAVTFCDLVKGDGYQPMVYASVSWMENKLDYNRINNYDLWVAQYHNVCQYEHPCNIWQYSSTGSVNGIEGNVDMNWCYGLKSAGY